MNRSFILAAAFVAAAPAFAETPSANPGAKIPAPTLATAPSKLAPEAQRLDLNSATLEQLMAVKGFNKPVAEAIVKARPFKSVDELSAKKIVSGPILIEVRDQLMVR